MANTANLNFGKLHLTSNLAVRKANACSICNKTNKEVVIGQIDKRLNFHNIVSHTF